MVSEEGETGTACCGGCLRGRFKGMGDSVDAVELYHNWFFSFSLWRVQWLEAVSREM